MSARRLTYLAPVLVLVFVVAAVAYGAKPKPAAPRIDPKALGLLQQMQTYMNGLQSYSVHVDATRDVVSPATQVLTSSQAFDVSVEKPDHFRVHMMSAAGSANVIYNGSNIFVYSPTRNVYAVQPAPPTIRQALQAMANRGIEMPLVSLFSPTRPIRSSIVSGVFVGTSLMNGVDTNQLAFRGKNVDFQIWIQNDPSAPLPVKVIIVDNRVSGKPRYTASLTNWNTSPTFETGFFSFTPPAGAQKINFSQLPKQPRNWTRGARPAPTR